MEPAATKPRIITENVKCFRKSTTNSIQIKAKLNGEDYNFIVDSGSSHTLVNCDLISPTCLQNSRTSTDSGAFQGASGANGSKNNVDELLSKLTSVLDSYKTGSQHFNTAAKVFKPQRKVYDPCIYCSKSNHESSRCYFKPANANATTQNQSLNN